MTTPWAHDKLHRRADGEHLIKVMIERYEARKAAGRGSYILNIDAAWGTGKTFFLDNLAMDLRQNHVVGMVNAWQDDHANDPLITVMAAIEDALQPFLDEGGVVKEAFDKGKQALGIVAAEASKQMAFHALKITTGIGVQAIADRVREAAGTKPPASNGKAKKDDKDDSFDKSFEKVWEASLKTLVGERVTEHRRTNEAIATFKAQTAKAIEYAVGKGMRAPMFVCIDELDRCRPTYAIKLLEDVKHLFDIEGVVFVVATDSEQLSHSIKAIYGAEFEARKYLRRFFDRVFVFPDAARAVFVAHLFASNGLDAQSAFFPTSDNNAITHVTTWADGLQLSNRDLAQCFEIISTFVTSWEHEVPVEPVFLLALVAAFYTDDRALFRRIETGASLSPSVLEDWVISYQYFDRDHGEYRSSSISGAQLAQSASYRMLDRSVQTGDAQGSLTNYYAVERQLRFPKGMSFNDKVVTLLSEYPSRVKNAGRVIDK